MHVREVMKRAMAHSATAIIIVHNQPSGDPTPSQADVKLTRELAEAGRHMKVTVHDHIIIIALRSDRAYALWDLCNAR